MDPSELGEDLKPMVADLTPEVGPVRAIFGRYGEASSTVPTPSEIDYLMVYLEPEDRRTFAPRPGHEGAWSAVANGSVAAARWTIAAESIAVLDRREASLAIEAAARGATFELEAAVPHDHDLRLGHHSVHTSPAALRLAEGNIESLRLALVASPTAETPLAQCRCSGPHRAEKRRRERVRSGRDEPISAERRVPEPDPSPPAKDAR